MSALDARGRALVAGVWAFRSRSEREAADRFGRLARQLAENDAAPVVVELAERAVDDELRHIRLCATIAADYGHAGPVEEAPVAAEIGPRSLGSRDRLLYEMVAFCCVTESINAALMTVSHAMAEDPSVRSAVREILKDEVTHSRMGWAHLASERSLRGDQPWLGEALPAMLAGTVREELFASDQGAPPDPRLPGHGELPIALRRRIFVETLESVVFPGLEAHGVSTRSGRSWIARLAARRADAPERSLRA